MDSGSPHNLRVGRSLRCPLDIGEGNLDMETLGSDRMELRHLRYFVAVARCGTVTAAANHVHISQPALTYQLKQMEEELGVKLLERNPRGISLTPAGEVLLAKAEAVLTEMEAIKPALMRFRGPAKRHVTFGIAPTPARALAADLIDACTRSGRFEIDIREAFSDDLHRMVALGELDCALFYGTPDPGRSIASIALVREALFAIAAPKLFAGVASDVIRFEELATLLLVLESTGMIGRRLVDEAAAERGLTLDVVTASSIPVKKEVIARNDRSTVGPVGLYAEELAAGTLRARRIVEPELVRTLCFGCARNREHEMADLTALVIKLVRTHADRGVLHWQRLDG
ncbi:LysR family transcriptional regulator [Pseudochelatococcus sp. B33]